jgi:hypothetical protein
MVRVAHSDSVNHHFIVFGICIDHWRFLASVQYSPSLQAADDGFSLALILPKKVSGPRSCGGSAWLPDVSMCKPFVLENKRTHPPP